MSAPIGLAEVLQLSILNPLYLEYIWSDQALSWDVVVMILSGPDGSIATNPWS